MQVFEKAFFLLEFFTEQLVLCDPVCGPAHARGGFYAFKIEEKLLRPADGKSRRR